VPLRLAERAREFAAGGLSPAVPRDAATVILIRQAPDLEAFLLRRTRALEFAPGACVFPGGSVDERDADPAIGDTAWAGPSPAELGDQLGISADRAPSLVQEGGALAQDRRRLLGGSVSLGELLGRRGLVLRADLLTPWARWITPEVSPRRFDTWFFAAALPPGQIAALTTAAGPGAQPDPGESDSGTWLRPGAALEAARVGQITLLPPTAVTLAELAAHQDVAGVLAQRRTITPLLPRVVVEEERAWLAMPQAVHYPL